MDHRQEIDRITAVMIEMKERTEALKIEDVSEEEVQGLKYRKGDVLRETVTGREVIVLAGKRAIGTISIA